MRTDIHSPKNFDPANYNYVGSFDNFPAPGSFVSAKEQTSYDTAFGTVLAFTYDHADYKAAHDLLEREGAKIHFDSNKGTSQCDHCGAHIRYVSIYRHIDGEVVAVGDTCAADRFGCADRRAFDIKRLKEHAASARESQRAFGAASTFIQQAAPELAEWMLNPIASEVGPIFLDISRKLIRYGKISERQVDFCRRLLQEYYERQRNGGKSDRELQFEKEREAAEDCPTGRIVIIGTVLSTKVQESDFGPTLKMVVKDDRGFRVYVTVPSTLSPERGDKVRFTATVEPSNDDPKFGFGKRPSKATILSEEVVNAPQSIAF